MNRKNIANALRILSMDSVQEANSGHPGTAMGMSDIAEVLWRDYLNHNPCNPKWINRDRFILSNGHSSILLYSLLHLTGYNITLNDLKKFRQINSKTPGHPECNITDGVEVSTGPLGQGIANAVGLAIGEHVLSSQFNRDGIDVINHYTYVFLGDGCMMEGISHESCSLAGNLKLGKLIAFYDRNNISMDGNTKNWFNDNTLNRFKAYGWHVIDSIDGHNSIEIKLAIDKARSVCDKPSLIICRTIIAYGSPNKSGTNIAHGAPLGIKETYAVRKKLKWHRIPFDISKKMYKIWNARKSGQKKENIWMDKFKKYKKLYPKLANELIRRRKGYLPKNWYTSTKKIIHALQMQSKKVSGRQASQNTLELLGPKLPELIGGSADLTYSNLTKWSKSIPINKCSHGNYIHYGVRELGMTAIANGIANYGGFIPYTSTFLVFIDYAYSAIRMAALMQSKHIMIYTHDSIGIGADGPTHQPIEQLTHLRTIPNLSNWRPCDQTETAVAWKKAIERDGPTAIILSRQDLIHQYRNKEQVQKIYKGGYILKNCYGIPDLILIASGSEVSLAVNTYNILIKKGYKVRVVSMPSTDVFDSQSKIYREFVLPKSVKARIAIEAGATIFWYKYVGLDGEILGINKFGKSASGTELFIKFGFTVRNLLKKAYKILNKKIFSK